MIDKKVDIWSDFAMRHMFNNIRRIFNGKEFAFLFFVIFAIVFSLVFTGCSELKGIIPDKNKAKELALEYVARTYEQEMCFVRVEYIFGEPTLYYVYFSPENNPDLIFKVMVQKDLTISPEKTNKYGNYFRPDNYYIANFEYLMEKEFSSDIQTIWVDGAEIIGRVPNNAVYAFRMPKELSDELALLQMDGLIEEYLLIIDTKHFLKDEETEKQDEAERILEFINSVKASGYSPQRIVFWYDIPKIEQYGIPSYSFTKAGSGKVSFEDWKDIETTERIAHDINESIFFSRINKEDDAYYKEYFAKELGKKFEADAKNIWGEDAIITAEMHSHTSISEYRIYGLTKDVNVEDIEYKLQNGYMLDFILPVHFDINNAIQKEEEAEKIYRLIRIIQDSGYGPDIISFTYYYPGSERQHRVNFFMNWGEIRWQKVSSKEDILERFDGAWYDND